MAPATSSAPRFHPLTVAHVEPEAAGAVAIRLSVPAELRERFAFEPGQFLTLRAKINGQNAGELTSGSHRLMTLRGAWDLVAPPGNKPIPIEEVEPATFVAVVEELAMADASTAWGVAQASGCSLAAAYVEPAVAREIFGAPDAVLAWSEPETWNQMHGYVLYHGVLGPNLT